jgi:4'-phosphopantetheinyl transferase
MIHWQLQHWEDLPSELRQGVIETLLTPDETTQWARLTYAKRRNDWLLGRWTAKLLLQSYLQEQTQESVPMTALSIRNEADGSPYCTIGRTVAQPAERLPVSLSISHSHGVAFCAITQAQSPALCSVGADIEWIETRASGFVGDYFSPAENEFIHQFAGQFSNHSQDHNQDHIQNYAQNLHQYSNHYDLFVTAIWSAKEAVLKAEREGLRIDTKSVECIPSALQLDDEQWRPFSIRLDAVREPRFAAPARWSGWWRTYQNFVMSLVVKN